MRSETIRPAYVIGADGYDSAVRRMSGIEMEEHGAGQIFSVYEIEAAGELPAEVRVILDPDRTSVYWPLEEGRCRWGFQIRDASEHAASMERLAQLIAARAPWCMARPTHRLRTLGPFLERRHLFAAITKIAQSPHGGRGNHRESTCELTGPIRMRQVVTVLAHLLAA